MIYEDFMGFFALKDNPSALRIPIAQILEAIHPCFGGINPSKMGGFFVLRVML